MDKETEDLIRLMHDVREAVNNLTSAATTAMLMEPDKAKKERIRSKVHRQVGTLTMQARKACEEWNDYITELRE